jgi:hypothetical protein
VTGADDHEEFCLMAKDLDAVSFNYKLRAEAKDEEIDYCILHRELAMAKFLLLSAICNGLSI